MENRQLPARGRPRKSGAGQTRERILDSAEEPISAPITVLLSKAECDSSNDACAERAQNAAHDRPSAFSDSSDSSLETGRAIHRIFEGVASRFIAMLREACPELSPEEFHWRLVCILGGMTYLLAEPGRVRRLVGPGFEALDKDAAMACAMPFLGAGMSAPPARTVPGGAQSRVARAGAGDLDAFQKHTLKPTAGTSSPA